MTGRAIATALLLVAGAAWLGGVAPDAARALDCSLGDCGTATLEPTSGTPGTVVTVRVDNGWFGEPWIAELVEIDCFQAAVGYAAELPSSGTFAPLTIVDADSATFVMPELAPGDYRVRFTSCGDEAFGQPEVVGVFTVLAVPATDAARTAAPATPLASWGALVLATAGTIGLVASLARRRRPVIDR